MPSAKDRPAGQGGSAYSRPMIVPRIPPALVPLVGGGELDVSVGEGDDDVSVGVGDGEELVGGVVCLDFEGVGEDGWLAGLVEVPGFAVPVP
jgi:hypothetical protein